MQDDIVTTSVVINSRRGIAPHPNPIYAFYGFSKTIEKRFWNKVKKTESCWIWTAAKLVDGYGQLSRGSQAFDRIYPKMVRANIASWIIHKGHIPEGMCVCHNCPGGDNPSCVNPDHLWLGTKKDNSQDCSKKNRWGDRKGENSTRHKLTWKQVEEIRADNRKTSARKLAIFYGVSRAAIRFVLSGHSWKIISQSIATTQQPK